MSERARIAAALDLAVLKPTATREDVLRCEALPRHGLHAHRLLEVPRAIAMRRPKMNRLALNRGYLCGAMDRVTDGGIGWRQDLMESLKELKILWLDPCRKPIDIGVEDLENRALRRKAKWAGDFEFVRTQMKQIRPVDLRMVDICDFVVCNLDLEVHACGTYEELFWANRMKKPVIVRVAQRVENTPDWLFGTLPFELIFSTWGEVKAYLLHIAHDSVIDRLNRWYFFNWMGEHCAVEPNLSPHPRRSTTARRK
jgi:hypothetical protein